MTIVLPDMCRNCGGGNFKWMCAPINQGSALDGRIRMSEVACAFFLACDDCSETLKQVSADEIMQHLDRTLVQPSKIEYGPSVIGPLMELHQACEKAQVSYGIHWNESDSTWYIDISSAAPSERYVGKDYSGLGVVIELALKHVRNLSAQNPS